MPAPLRPTTSQRTPSPSRLGRAGLLDGAADGRAVEAAGQAAVAGQEQDRDVLRLSRWSSSGWPWTRVRPRRLADQLGHRVGERPQRLDALLRAAQLGAGDELHRLRHLAGVADGADPPLDVLLGRQA